MKRFALIGAAGYVAPRHIKAVHDTGNELVSAVDISDSAGVLDGFFPRSAFFKDIEVFEQSLYDAGNMDYVSICSPNYLHEAHIALALRAGCDVICEKPLVISGDSLQRLKALEADAGRRIWAVLQLRVHPQLIDLKRRLSSGHEAALTYITPRGSWYAASWKSDDRKSGGLAFNIGIHLFDLLLWLFGPVSRCELHLNDRTRLAGVFEMEKGTVRWFLSVDRDDLPFSKSCSGNSPHRLLIIDGKEIEFSGGFTNLHTKVYSQIIAGNGIGLEESGRAVHLVDRLNSLHVSASKGMDHHPLPGLQKTAIL